MPNRPMTAIRKSKPLRISVKPKVRRSWPVTLSRPTAASAKPIIIDDDGLERRLLAHADERAERQEEHREFFRRPELQGELVATSGATSVMTMTANSAPTKDEVKAAVSASPALPCCAIGWPSNVVATDHGSPGMLNSTEVMAPPNSAPQ